MQITLELSYLLTAIGGIIFFQFTVGGFMLAMMFRVEERSKHYANTKVMAVDQKLEKFIRDSDLRQKDHNLSQENLISTINKLTHAVGVLTGKVDSWSG